MYIWPSLRNVHVIILPWALKTLHQSIFRGACLLSLALLKKLALKMLAENLLMWGADRQRHQVNLMHAETRKGTMVEFHHTFPEDDVPNQAKQALTPSKFGLNVLDFSDDSINVGFAGPSNSKEEFHTWMCNVHGLASRRFGKATCQFDGCSIRSCFAGDRFFEYIRFRRYRCHSEFERDPKTTWQRSFSCSSPAVWSWVELWWFKSRWCTRTRWRNWHMELHTPGVQTTFLPRSSCCGCHIFVTNWCADYSGWDRRSVADEQLWFIAQKLLSFLRWILSFVGIRAAPGVGAKSS